MNTRPTSNRGTRSPARGVAAEEMRRHNLGTVLERLHLLGPASRSELAAVTGLNRSTIADLVGQLTDLGLTEESPGPTGSGPGRPSPVVETRPTGASVLAVDLAVDSIAVATVGLGGHVYNRLRISRPRGRFSPAETLQDVAKLAGPLLDSLPSPGSLSGVGVAVVGVTRRSDGFVHMAPNLGWREVPLGEMLAGALDVETAVMVANDADLGALAEHRRGRHPAGTLVYVSGESGIGVGVIVDGQPMLGASGYAGEAGHTLINPGGVRCRCGAFGCWETEAGEAALLRRIPSLEPATGLETVERVEMLAAAGDRGVLDAIGEVGTWLGLGIGNLINLFNPDRVVLGGIFQHLFELLEPALVEGARRTALQAAGEVASIGPSDLGSDAPLIGAAELALARVVRDPAGARAS